MLDRNPSDAHATFKCSARNPFRNRRHSRFWACVLASYLCTFRSKPVQESMKITFVGTSFSVVPLYISLETRCKNNEYHVFEHVFWRRTYIFIYLYTFGAKPVQKSSKITCFGMCFGIVLIYVWLETRSKTGHYHFGLWAWGCGLWAVGLGLWAAGWLVGRVLILDSREIIVVVGRV